MISQEKIGIASLEQIQAWDYHMQLPSGVPQEVLSGQVNFAGIDLQLLQAAIECIVRETDTLRTVLFKENGTLYQKVIPYIPGTARLAFVDITAISNQDVYIEQFKDEHAAQILVNDTAPLCRFYVFKKNDDSFRLLFLLHHIISDSWSVSLIRNLIPEVYDKIARGEKDLSLRLNEFSLLDYASWQKNMMDTRKANMVNYWQNMLRVPLDKTIGTPRSTIAAALNGRNSRSDGWNKTGEEILQELNIPDYKLMLVELSPECRNDIRWLMEHCKVNLLTIFYCGFILFPWVHHQSGNTLIASPIAIRFNPKTKNLVGPLAGAIYGYSTIDENLTVLAFLPKTYFDLMKSVRYMIYDHPAIDLDGIRLRLKCDLFLNVITSEFDPKLDSSRVLRGEVNTQSGFYALACVVVEMRDTIYLDWTYHNRYYDKNSIAYIMQVFASILHQLRQNLDASLLQIKQYSY